MPITLFACEPSPTYVFGTGVKMVPSTSLQGVRRHLTDNCDMIPDLDNHVLSNSFRAPLEFHRWSDHENPEDAKAKAPRELAVDRLNVETISSPVFHSWSTYYGPGQAMAFAVLDLTRPPFEKATEQTLNSALIRTLSGTLKHDTILRKRLTGRVIDINQGLWVRSNSNSKISSSSPATPSSSSSSLPPHLLLGDRSVHIDKDKLATLHMSIIVEGPVRGTDPNVNPWVRLGADPNLWRGLPTALTATSLAEAGGSDSQALRAGDGLDPEALYIVAGQMLLHLAKQLKLSKPPLVDPNVVFPDKTSGLWAMAAAADAASWFLFL
ncbi:hypothetical protein PG984_003077 [Apiospora sp. TS-2023a]